MGESVYLKDNVFVRTVLYEKKNGYFSFFLFSEERMFFLHLENVLLLKKIVPLVNSDTFALCLHVRKNAYIIILL